MPRLFYRRWMTALIGFGFLFTWSGYRSLAADSTPTPTLTVEPAATQEGTLAPLNVLFGPGTFKFPFPAAGLADLSSYRATLTLTFKGTNSGQSTQSTAWSRTYVMLTSQKPAARQLTINSSDSAATPVFTTEMSGVVYSHDGQNDCIATTAQQGNSLAERLEPAGFLPGVIGAEGGSSETVNSVTASHYTFDERALGQKGITQSKGELWVATTGGFLVKYRLVTTGGADYFGDGITGTISSDYELTDVNQPITINLPADCPAGMVDAPLMPDVTNVFKAPGLLSYSTVSSVTDVTAFYQKQLVALGWQVSGPPSISETVTLLGFTQGTQKLSVFISTTDGNTSVRIFLESVAIANGNKVLSDTKTPLPTKTPVPTRTPTNTIP